MNSIKDDHRLVFCCEHVFRDSGDWQFLCGQGDHPESNDPAVVGVGHLVEANPSLAELADLPKDWEAERRSKGERWLRTPMQPDH